jgi:cell division protein FtsQ
MYGINKWFMVDNVIITGDISHINISELNQIVTNDVNRSNLITLDISNLYNDITHIPWIKQVVISRDFPHSLILAISQYDAIANFSHGGLISANGVIFNGDNNESLPIFDVPIDYIHDTINNYKLLNKQFSSHNVTVSKLFFNGLGITKVRLSNNLRLTFCGSDIINQVNNINNYWDKLYKINPQLNYINTCYQGAFAINMLHRNAQTVHKSHSIGAN